MNIHQSEKEMAGPKKIKKWWEKHPPNTKDIEFITRYFQGIPGDSSNYLRRFSYLTSKKYSDKRTHVALMVPCVYWLSQGDKSIPEIESLFAEPPFNKCPLTPEELAKIEDVAEKYPAELERFLNPTKEPFDSLSRKLPEKINNQKIIFVAGLIVIVAVLLILISNNLFQNNINSTAVATPVLSNLTYIPTENTIIENGIEFDMVYAPAGCFTMGNNNGRENERPAHRVCVNEFWIGKTEVTNGQFGAPPDEECNLNQVDNARGPVNFTGPEYPHNCVLWIEAYEYCQEHNMRLPTEAEWEWAARGPDGYLYPWGNDFDNTRAVVQTNFNDPADPAIMLPAGSIFKGRSWTGALDMAGSLREFTSTIYAPEFSYPYDSTDGRESPENVGASPNHLTTVRVVRGGSFDDYGGDRNRMTFRYDEWYDFLFNIYGFRCVKDVDPSQ